MAVVTAHLILSSWSSKFHDKCFQLYRQMLEKYSQVAWYEFEGKWWQLLGSNQRALFIVYSILQNASLYNIFSYHKDWDVGSTYTMSSVTKFPKCILSVILDWYVLCKWWILSMVMKPPARYSQGLDMMPEQFHICYSFSIRIQNASVRAVRHPVIIILISN